MEIKDILDTPPMKITGEWARIVVEGIPVDRLDEVTDLLDDIGDEIRTLFPSSSLTIRAEDSLGGAEVY